MCRIRKLDPIIHCLQIVGCFVFLICYSSQVWGEKIVIAGDLWCPFNCEPESSKPGYMIEIATRVFEKKNHQVEYKVLPWARAILEAREGRINAIVGAYKEDAPDFIFPKNELALLKDVFFGLVNSNWIYNGMASLNKIKLGVTNGYAYADEELNVYIRKNSLDNTKLFLATGDSPLRTNIRVLTEGGIDALIENDQVFMYKVNEMHLQQKFKPLGVLGQAKASYIAFSPKLPTSKKFAEALSDGLAALRKSGELKGILKKYGAVDWR